MLGMCVKMSAGCQQKFLKETPLQIRRLPPLQIRRLPSAAIRTKCFTNSTPALAMAQWENRELLIQGFVVGNHQSSIGFSSKVNFDDVFSVLAKTSKSIVQSTSQVLHQSFRAQIAMFDKQSSKVVFEASRR